MRIFPKISKPLQVNLEIDDESTHVDYKCKLCGNEGGLTLNPSEATPLTLEDSMAGRFTFVVEFECLGCKSTEFVYGSGWKAFSMPHDTLFENIDFTGQSNFEGVDLDENGGSRATVMISTSVIFFRLQIRSIERTRSHESPLKFP
ncbi:hypothetical protein CCACVL1_23046 [Corchorus capsularis]|uniref:Uncharacterized protein n=1 Tax=Corchorus capsularis TaxID=210143 RepID=A0A1R3GVB4_COCAP|nr:hypothetical protein CCACVL1_23046 [Corchorus capsularis]